MILVLEKIDLKQSLKKDAYNEKMSYFETRLGELQRACRAAGIPVIILFEGWRGSQRSVIINHMMQQMDARGFRVYSASKMADEEPDQPFFEPFWRQLPAKSNMAVYYRSWYYLKNEYTFDRDADQVKRINTSYRHINAFEKQLTDDNYVLLKFFVHVSEKQLKANVQKAEKTYGKGWNKVSESDDDFVDYQRYLEIYEKMFIDSDRPNAHWYLIAGDDTRFAEVSIFDVIVQRLELALAEAEARRQKAGQQLVLPRTEIYDVLSKVDLSKEIAKAEYKDKLDKYQSKLSILQYEMYKKGIPSVFGFEGWDAGGKGGAIRRLTAALDPLGYSVNPVAAPNVVEKSFNYLWRFWTRFPKQGEIAIFDRTWYGRVMVERIEGFATQDEWGRAYAEINEMEAQWAEYGTVIGKFWLQIDKDEQYKRFKEREQNPNKEWKITDEDWRNREKWDAYEAAVNEMLVRTSTDYAPWTIVEGNNKYYARLKVLKTVIEMFEKRLKD